VPIIVELLELSLTGARIIISQIKLIINLIMLLITIKNVDLGA